MICGSTFNNDAYVAKTDSIGKLLWSKIFGKTKTYKPEDIIQTKDKGYIVFGYSVGDNFWDNDAWILKLNKNGETEWNKTYGSDGEDVAFTDTQASDGGYVFTGQIYNFLNNGNLC